VRCLLRVYILSTDEKVVVVVLGTFSGSEFLAASLSAVLCRGKEIPKGVKAAFLMGNAFSSWERLAVCGWAKFLLGTHED
jgi:hypothetical protein